MAGHTGLAAFNEEAGPEVMGGEAAITGLRGWPPAPVTFLTSCKRDQSLGTLQRSELWSREQEVSRETSLLNRKYLVTRDSPQSKGS